MYVDLAAAASIASIFFMVFGVTVTVYLLYMSRNHWVYIGDERDFFISYTKADESWAEWIAEVLEKHGYSTFFQKRDTPAGESFVKWVNSALVSSKNVIAVWSKAYSQSPYGMMEFEAAYVDKLREKKGLLLPVRVEDVEIDKVYGRFARVDLFGANQEELEHRLLDAVRTCKKTAGHREKRSKAIGLRWQRSR